MITDSVFYGNYGADFGGAIYMESVGVDLRNVLLESNACAPVRGLGGGLASALYYFEAKDGRPFAAAITTVLTAKSRLALCAKRTACMLRKCAAFWRRC